MADRGVSFDSAGFYDAIDAHRQAQKKTWRKVASDTGISASTFTRMAQGRRPDVNSLAALCAWSGLQAEDFVRGASGMSNPEPLAMISTLLRGDKNLTPDAAKALDELVKATYGRLRRDSG